MARPYSVSTCFEGQPVFIIGGGPSLTLAQIRAIAMMRIRRRCRVVAVNDAVYPAWWADWLHSCDFKWWRWHIQGVQHFKGTKTCVAEDVPDSWVDGYLERTGHDGFDEDPSHIRTGGCSVYQAMHIAIHAGATRIGLVGVDMRRGPGGEAHWFGDHPDKLSPLSPAEFYESMGSAFETLRPALHARGIEVANCSPGSALTAFPARALEDTIRSWCGRG
jgi:hypothetical protein